MLISSRPDYKTIKNNQSVSKVEGVSKLNKPIIFILSEYFFIKAYSENQQKGKDKRNDSFIRVLIHFQKDFCKTP